LLELRREERWVLLQQSQKRQTAAVSKDAIYPDVHFSKCPIKASMAVFVRKWTMLLLRDIGFRKIDRFNHLLESIPGLTPRVLSMRLKELEKDGIIKKTADENFIGITRWMLTEKGKDTLPILIRLIAYGSKWYARKYSRTRPLDR
jgi:DNA-binding HxlR family transcriptional regulator